MDKERVIKKEILNIAKTPEEASEIAAYLSSLNWHEVFAEQERLKQLREDERKREIQEMITQGGGHCDDCNKLVRKLSTFSYPNPYTGKPWAGKYCLSCINEFEKACEVPCKERVHKCGNYGCSTILPYKLLVQHDKIETNGYGYCHTCLEKLVEEATITCVTCGCRTMEYTYISKERSTCKDCYIKPPLWQAVATQNSRARANNLPATLTDDQWDHALRYFNNKCAYCITEPYQVLEHFMPIIKSGGTTADNCVPACFSCNSKKGGRHPDKINRLFPSDNLARIREYLASVATKQSA
jgi:5-methylcytosine-specific restriction endonuclease McrA